MHHLYVIIEFIGGYISGSMAIMTDAAHLLSDFSGFVISMASVWIGTKEASRRLTFGYHRAEVIGALASVILIWGLTLILVLEAIERVIHPVDVDGKTMLITAFLGLVFNLIMVKVLHGSHSHSHHGCSHSNAHDDNIMSYEMEELGIDQIDLGCNQDPNDEESLELRGHDSLDTPDVLTGQFSKSFDMDSIKLETQEDSSGVNKSNIYYSKDGGKHESLGKSQYNERRRHNHNSHSHSHSHNHSTNLNVRAAVIHVIGDLIQAVGVLIAAMIIYVVPSWQIIDPICTFMFSILVIFTTYYIVKDCMMILLEGVPHGISYNEVFMNLERIKGVISVKYLHIWALTSGKYCIAAKIIGRDNNKIVSEVHEICREKFHINRCFIEVNTV